MTTYPRNATEQNADTGPAGHPSTPDPSGEQKSSGAARTEEIIAHVARGKVTPQNPVPRRINRLLARYLENLNDEEQRLRAELVPLQQILKDMPEVQREQMHTLLETNSAVQRLVVERRLMRRAVPLILEYDHVTRLLRKDRLQAYEYVGWLKRRLLRTERRPRNTPELRHSARLTETRSQAKAQAEPAGLSRRSA